MVSSQAFHLESVTSSLSPFTTLRHTVFPARCPVLGGLFSIPLPVPYRCGWDFSLQTARGNLTQTWIGDGLISWPSPVPLPPLRVTTPLAEAFIGATTKPMSDGLQGFPFRLLGALLCSTVLGHPDASPIPKAALRDGTRLIRSPGFLLLAVASGHSLKG